MTHPKIFGVLNITGNCQYRNSGIGRYNTRYRILRIACRGKCDLSRNSYKLAARLIVGVIRSFNPRNAVEVNGEITV